MAETLELPAQLDLEVTEKLHQTLVGLRGQPVTLAGAKVSFVGGLFAQLLIAAHKCWGEEGQELRIDNPSQSFADGLTRLGLDVEQFTGGVQQ